MQTTKNYAELKVIDGHYKTMWHAHDGLLFCHLAEVLVEDPDGERLYLTGIDETGYLFYVYQSEASLFEPLSICYRDSKIWDAERRKLGDSLEVYLMDERDGQLHPPCPLLQRFFSDLFRHGKDGFSSFLDSCKGKKLGELDLFDARKVKKVTMIQEWAMDLQDRNGDYEKITVSFGEKKGYGTYAYEVSKAGEKRGMKIPFLGKGKGIRAFEDGRDYFLDDEIGMQMQELKDYNPNKTELLLSLVLFDEKGDVLWKRTRFDADSAMDKDGEGPAEWWAYIYYIFHHVAEAYGFE